MKECRYQILQANPRFHQLLKELVPDASPENSRRFTSTNKSNRRERTNRFSLADRVGDVIARLRPLEQASGNLPKSAAAGNRFARLGVNKPLLVPP